MSSLGVNLEKYRIPLDEIVLATQNFDEQYLIGAGASGRVYKGQLSERLKNQTVAIRRLDSDAGHQGKHEFLNELVMFSSFNHENITHFIGYCDEGYEMIIVFEYATSGSLDAHLHDPNRRRFLTWAQRLKICIGIARGLEYLHSGLGEDFIVLHRDIKSGNILLDEKLEAKISDFGLSLLVNRNKLPVYESVVGSKFYLDPIYKDSSMVNTESDIYSFGMILFEMLTGMLAYIERVIGDDTQPQRLINMVRRYYDDGVDNLVDPLIKDQINVRSLIAFKDIAYECISWNLKDRPMMKKVIDKIQEALDIQIHGEASTDTIRSRQPQNLEGFRIPLKEIQLATENFNTQRCIGSGSFGKVYKGQLSEHWSNTIVAIKRLNGDSYQGKHEFHKELQMISSFHHQNIIPFIGYCDENNEIIIVYEYAVSGSLDHYLQGPNKGSCITWAHRLKICLGAARGLEYLHSGLGGDNTLIHRDIKSSNILLGDSLEAKICDFGLSLLVNRNQPKAYDLPSGTSYYRDPIYGESGNVNTDLDVYSFGVVLLEILSGTLAHNKRSIGNDQPQTLISLVRRCYDDGPDILIDPVIGDQTDIRSLHVFTKIMYRCISYNLENRPTMKRVIKRIEEALDIQTRTHMALAPTIRTPSHQHQDLKSFRIPLIEIIFSQEPHNRIGDGGFGKVYKGQLSKLPPSYTVAIKCLDPKGHQGKKEFLTEVELISSFHHQNIIPFVGYCDDSDQMIIVSQYASNGSLDHHLMDETKRNLLTWAQRLKICLGAAKGLDYLHSGLGKDNRVIHRDVKSGNILLDENMEAKLCDFGLSKQGPRNQQRTQIYTKAAGTEFYLDPAYHESGILSKESDVYSFGVVLFEMLSGRPAFRPTKFVDGTPQFLIYLVRRYYNHGLEKLIDPVIRNQIDKRCFHIFKEIAYQCISLKSEERPTMDTIIDKIEDAMDF